MLIVLEPALYTVRVTGRLRRTYYPDVLRLAVPSPDRPDFFRVKVEVIH